MKKSNPKTVFKKYIFLKMSKIRVLINTLFKDRRGVSILGELTWIGYHMSARRLTRTVRKYQLPIVSL